LQKPNAQYARLDTRRRLTIRITTQRESNGRGRQKRLRAFEVVPENDERTHLHLLGNGERAKLLWVMRLTPIQVQCYAGARADETPRRFACEERTLEVGEVLDRWYQVESQPEWPRANYFKVRAEDDRQYLLKHDLESDEWFLGVVRKSHLKPTRNADSTKLSLMRVSSGTTETPLSKTHQAQPPTLAGAPWDEKS